MLKDKNFEPWSLVKLFMPTLAVQAAVTVNSRAFSAVLHYIDNGVF